jgi:hypothetical protein
VRGPFQWYECEHFRVRGSTGGASASTSVSHETVSGATVSTDVWGGRHQGAGAGGVSDGATVSADVWGVRTRVWGLGLRVAVRVRAPACLWMWVWRVRVTWVWVCRLCVFHTTLPDAPSATRGRGTGQGAVAV